MTFQISTDQSTAVATDYYWLPINADTPRGVKLQLLGAGGVAFYGMIVGDAKENSFLKGWAPLPKIPKASNAD